MSGAVKDLLIAFAIAAIFALGWLAGERNAVRTASNPTTCPVLDVRTINDAIVVVRECRDGSIVLDYPHREE